MIVPHAPDFHESVPEVATKHVFNYETREWTNTQVFVNLDETPFSKGSLRVVYHLQDLGGVDAVSGMSNTHSRQRRSMSSPPPVSMHKVMPTTLLPSHRKGDTFVAKLAIDPDEDPQTYFRDIELQAHCAFYAQVYNSYHPPKRVEFIKAWVLELTERCVLLEKARSRRIGSTKPNVCLFGWADTAMARCAQWSRISWASTVSTTTTLGP
jgi:elongation factor 2 kinase